MKINKILILGSGTLGLRIGLQAAISKYQVIIYDIHKDAFTKAKDIHTNILRGLVKRGIVQSDELQPIASRISWTTDLPGACKDVDFVSESVTEDLEIKKELWAKVGSLCPEHTIFTTNTSYMLASMMADDTGRPSKFCAFHFHDVFWANVVDIMPHPTTDQAIVDLLFDMGRRLNQTPVLVKKENSGYIFNAMLMAVLGAAGFLRMQDVASIYDIDRSWMGNFKMEIGPFGIMDTVGLDTAWHIIKARKDPKSVAFAALLETYVKSGKLGVKTGEGFYSYPKPKFKEEGFVQGL